MPNNHEMEPLITSNDTPTPTCSTPTSTIPPPYHDEIPLFSRRSNPPHVVSEVRRDDTKQDRATFNVFARDIQADALREVYDYCKQSGDAAPTINLHIGCRSYQDNADGISVSFVDDDARNGDLESCSSRKHDHQKLRIVCQYMTGILGMILGGFCVWAIMEAIVRMVRS